MVNGFVIAAGSISNQRSSISLNKHRRIRSRRRNPRIHILFNRDSKALKGRRESNNPNNPNNHSNNPNLKEPV
jgi:hypothetical protein